MIKAVPLSSQWQPKNVQGFFAFPFKTTCVFSIVLQNATSSITQCWYIGTFKNLAVKETCKMRTIQVFK